MTLILIIVYCLLFAYLAWRHFNWALAVLFTLLPTYLIRFNIWSLPSTLLEAMVWIIAVVWTLKKLKYKVSSIKYQNFFSKYNSIILAIFLFLLGATISVFTSDNLRAALGEWKAFYVEPLIVFLILIDTLTARGSFDSTRFARSAQDDAKKLAKIYTNKDPNNLTMKQFNNEALIEKIFFGLILSGLAVSILSIYQHFTGWMVPYSFWANRNTYRVTAWYGFPNGVGLFLAPLFPLALHIIKKEWNRLRNLKKMNYESRIMTRLAIIHYSLFIIQILFVPCSILAIIYAKSTGALVGIVAGIGVLLLCYKKTRWPAIIIGIFGLLDLFGIPNFSGLKQEILMQDYSGKLRLEMWGETSAYLIQHPIIGAGLASYEERIAPYRINKKIEIFHHPHNLLLTIWTNTGLIGLFGFVWIIVWFYRVGISKLRITNYELRNSLIPFLLSTMTVFLTTGLVDSPYIKNDMSILFWLLPALLITYSHYGNMENTKN